MEQIFRKTQKMAALFEGQGAQFAGMGKEMFDTYSYVRELFAEVSDVLKEDMCQLCFEDPDKKLSLTEYTQPALLTVETAAYLVLKNEFNWKPHYLAGHSLGEITGLVCGGAISVRDGAMLARKRGKFMQEAVPAGIGTMVAVQNCDNQFLKEICKNVNRLGYHLCIANYNSISQSVLSGEAEGIDLIVEQLKSQNIWNKKLNVSAPFHSPLMNDVAKKLELELSSMEIKDLQIPVLSNVTALPYTSQSTIREHILRQIVSPVKWDRCMDYLRWNDTFEMIDLGPGKVLKSLAKHIPQVCVYSLEEGIAYLAQQRDGKNKIKGIDFMEKCVCMAVGTPNYRTDDKHLESALLVGEVEKAVSELKEKQSVPDEKELQKAYEMLCQVWEEKQVSQEEQDVRINELKSFYM